jgi:hypothetical protein
VTDASLEWGYSRGEMAAALPPKRRQIPIATQVGVYFRGGWLCSLCDRPTIFPLAMKFAAGVVLDRKYELPIAYYDPKWRRDRSPLLDHLGCVIDHIEAHSRGSAHGRETEVAGETGSGGQHPPTELFIPATSQ